MVLYDPDAKEEYLLDGRYLVQPIKHAEWKRINVALYECSNCKRVAPYYIEGELLLYWPELNYCPACGAKMNEDEEMSKVSEMEMAYGEYLND